MPLASNKYLCLESWSVQCGHLAYDDARRTEDGVWYYGDIVSKEIIRFLSSRGLCLYIETSQEHRRDRRYGFVRSVVAVAVNIAHKK